MGKREVRVYLGDDDTYDLASNCTVRVVDADENVWFEIGIDDFLSELEERDQ